MSRSWWATLRTLAKYISWRDALLLVAAAGLAAAAALTGVAIPVLAGKLLGSMGASGQGWTLLLKLGAVVLGGFLARIASTWCLSASLEDVQASWRQAVFAALLARDMAAFDGASSSAETIARVAGEVRELKSTLRRVVDSGIVAAAQAAGGLASLFWLSPQLTVGLGGILLPAVALANVLGSHLRVLSRDVHAAHAAADAQAAEALGNIRTVRACTAEGEEFDRYAAKVQDAAEKSLWLSRAAGLFQGSVGLGVYGILGGLLAGGQSLVQAGALSPSDLGAYMMQAVRLQSSISHLSAMGTRVAKAMGSAHRIAEALEDRPIVNAPGGATWKPLRGDLTFHDVHFTYPTRAAVPVLRGMSFTVPAGSTVALVGSSGAGKSTVLSMLQRFYAPDAGSITVDGRELSHVDMQWLRGRTAVVPQSPTLFGELTIEENVRYGNPGATHADVQAALAAADCGFVDSLPQGRHTRIAERGVALSGGQRQRLAIARALLREPVLLCLDEFTSAQDAATEETLQAALAAVAASKTCIIIAHRLATVKRADKILFLKDGAVAEQGTHEELVAANGLYADMVRRQQLS